MCIFAEVLLCRQCGHSVVDGSEVVDIKSTLALRYKNASVLGPKGTLVQTFRNPQGSFNKLEGGGGEIFSLRKYFFCYLLVLAGFFAEN